ncbi:MAG TPA: crossover junction endodeoxyribonuclease RuvC [Candidatus Dormibacteraeota bacterium]|nr:crossover junction endodeoxyribonuclease RuvC [Candidatus Dormibacteraeota bacterium]
MERATIMIMMIVGELINSLFAARVCNAFDIFAGSKAVAEELVDSVLNPSGVILRLPVMRVLAIDASLRNTGVAIVDANNGKPRSVYFGTIHNASSMRSSSCLVAIRDRLVELIREHEPDCCALESVIYVQSHKTAILLGAARGAAILAAAENGLPVFEYSPRRIKQSAVGRGAAGKDQVAFMVRALLGLTETPGADAADALAIGLTHLRSQEAVAIGVPGGIQI